MKNRNLVIQKLKDARDRIGEVKSGGLKFRDSAEFKTWWDTTYKWLKQGDEHTSNESISFANLDFTGKTSHFHHDPANDLKIYEEACDRTRVYLDSAIKGIENNIADRYSDRLQSAGRVRMDNSHKLKIVQFISIREVLEALESEIEAKIDDPEERKGLHEKIKGIFQSPLSDPFLSQSLSEFLEKYFG